ncbi:MAG: hypothetical protein WAV72_07230, partial [Bradyrhizobium sp.]
SLFRRALSAESEFRHPEFFFHGDQDRRIFANDERRPLKGQGCPLIQEHLIHLAERADMFKRDPALPVLVARRYHQLSGFTGAVIRSPALVMEAPAFQVKRESPKHLRGREARFDPRLGAIDQRVDQYAGLLRIKRCMVDRVSHCPDGAVN